MFIEIIRVGMVRKVAADGEAVTVSRKALAEGRAWVTGSVVSSEEFTEDRVVLCDDWGSPVSVTVVGPYRPGLAKWVRFGVRANWVSSAGSLGGPGCFPGFSVIEVSTSSVKGLVMEFFRGKSLSAVRLGRLWVYVIHTEGERFRVLVQWGQHMEEPFVPCEGLPAGWSEVSAPEL